MSLPWASHSEGDRPSRSSCCAVEAHEAIRNGSASSPRESRNAPMMWRTSGRISFFSISSCQVGYQVVPRPGRPSKDPEA